MRCGITTYTTLRPSCQLIPSPARSMNGRYQRQERLERVTATAIEYKQISTAIARVQSISIFSRATTRSRRPWKNANRKNALGSGAVLYERGTRVWFLYVCFALLLLFVIIIFTIYSIIAQPAKELIHKPMPDFIPLSIFILLWNLPISSFRVDTAAIILNFHISKEGIPAIVVVFVGLADCSKNSLVGPG